jgi:transcription factor IIIB subunit 2
MKPTSNKEAVLCMHQDSKPFGYGLCEDCYKDFINVSGGLVGGSNPPAFQRAEKERMEKAAREENEGGISSLNHDEQLYVSFGALLFEDCSLDIFLPTQSTCIGSLFTSACMIL